MGLSHLSSELGIPRPFDVLLRSTSLFSYPPRLNVPLLYLIRQYLPPQSLQSSYQPRTWQRSSRLAHIAVQSLHYNEIPVQFGLPSGAAETGVRVQGRIPRFEYLDQSSGLYGRRLIRVDYLEVSVFWDQESNCKGSLL